MDRKRENLFPVIFILILTVFVASCSSSAPANTPIPSATRASPETHTSTPQPSPTATYHPPATSLFVIDPEDDARFLFETPTAIATPQEKQDLYSLKPWTEQDAIDLIRQMDKGAWNTGMPVRVAVQEALSRFPDSQNKDSYLWHLAFSRAVSGESGVDEWLMENMSKALNTGGYTPGSLNDFLKPYGFDAGDIHLVPNLFADGKMGWVYYVRTDEMDAQDGLFFAVRHQTSSNYELFKLDSKWNLYIGDSSIEEIGDQNKNGIPDIVLKIGAHGGTNCDGRFEIYEWDGTEFSDLSKGAFTYYECGSDWSRGQNDKNGVPTIVIDDYSFAQHSQNQYTWNGKFYEFTGYVDATPLQVWSYEKSSPANDVARLPGLLDSAEALKQGSSYPDYLRFRLAVAYALLSKPGQAIQEMQKLISTPRDPSIKVYAALAKTFLENYHVDADLYRACIKMGQLHQATREQTSAEDESALAATYGLSEDVIHSTVWFMSFPCDVSTTFGLLIKTFPTDSTDIPTLLQKNGVGIAYSASFDLNADGRLEWLVVDNEERWYLIALQDGIFQSHEAGGGSEQIPESVDVAHWAGIPDPALVLRGKNSLDIFTINKDFETNTVLSEWKLKSFSISASEIAPNVTLVYQDALPDDYYPSAPWAGYRWDAASRTFKDDLLEYQLFVEHNPMAAAVTAAQAFPLLDHWPKQLDFAYWNASYNYYLAGLAYELAGDNQKAIHVYWHLWHDYPESPYALMARAKLEPVQP